MQEALVQWGILSVGILQTLDAMLPLFATRFAAFTLSCSQLSFKLI